MKSEICPLNNELSSLNIILKEVESFTQKCELNKRDALRIRLLAEELKGMLPGLWRILKDFFGWKKRGKILSFMLSLM